MTSSIRWISRIFDISWFWPPKFQKHRFCFWMNKNDHKIKNLKIFKKKLINPRPAGPLDFPPPAGGGGRLNAPPPWSRLLVAVEKNERQRSKAREKSFRNHFGHFLAQVKIGVSRGQNSKIFQNGFSTIKSLILKIEQRIWYHCVCLVKARQTIYKMTLKGQGQSLTSGQVRPRSRDDQNGSYCISPDSPGQDERTDTNPTSLSLFDQKLLANDGWWPRVTSNDLWRGR